MSSNSSRAQRGATLIEVLVAVLVLSIGLLGVAALQAQALRNAGSSLQRSQATILAYAMFDAMRVNRDSAMAGAYDMSKTCAAPDAESLVGSDQGFWIQSLKTALGDQDSTCGQIECNGAQCTVTIYWSESLATQGVGEQTLAISSQI